MSGLPASRAILHGLFVGVILFHPLGLLAAPVVLYLKSGSVQKGELVRVTSRTVELRTPSGGSGTISFNHSAVDWAEFAPTSAWETAMTLYFQRDYEKAAVELEKIARERSAQNFYPAPGNFSALANRRLIDCYRRLLDAERLAPVVRRMEWGQIAKEESKVRSVVEVWASVGEGKWSAARLASEKLRLSLPVGDSRMGEVSYVEGLALEQLGEEEEALIAYGRTIGPYPGTDRRLAKDALQRSVQLLDKLEPRHPERDALLLIYAKSFGSGSLWEGASRRLQVGLESALQGKNP